MSIIANFAGVQHFTLKDGKRLLESYGGSKNLGTSDFLEAKRFAGKMAKQLEETHGGFLFREIS
jgi:hypothetical protein